MKNSNTLKHVFTALAVFITLSFSHSDEIATVECTVHGCLGKQKSKITIYKMDSSTIATLEKDGEISHKVKLSAQQLDTFYMFILDLKALEEGGSLCTDV